MSNILNDEEFNSLLQEYSYLKKNEIEDSELLVDGGSTARVIGKNNKNIKLKQRTKLGSIIATEAEAILMAVMNLKEGKEVIIYNDSMPLVQLLTNFRKKNRAYEDVYRLIKELEKRKKLKITYKWVSGLTNWIPHI